MGFYVNPPADGFCDVLNSNRYVDKTMLIDYMNSVLSTPDKLVVSTRPRRFGKSFAAKMLSAYYSKGANSEELFENLKISEKPNYQKYLNKYDVIFVDISTFASTADNIEETVSIVQSEIIEELKEVYPKCIHRNTKSLLKALMQINTKTGNKFFMIIDEWDALFREAPDNWKLQEIYIKFLHSLFKSPQTSQLFVGAYMTGILPIKKYGTQSALTDFREYTMLEPGPLAQFIGFTEAEVKALCEQYGINFEKAQEWYDGYHLSTNAENKYEHIYCPNSIMQLLSRRKFDSYWAKTETYESLRVYIDLNYDGIKENLIDMLGGKSCKIDIGTFQNDMTNISSKDDVFTLLVHLGYLSYDFESQKVNIPNEEIRQEFIRAVKEGNRPELAKAVKMSDKLLNATFNKDEECVARIIEATHTAETSPQHYNDEQALRYVVVMAYLTSIDYYLKFEEIASGRGYCDILFLPRVGLKVPALLIELKWDKSVDKAISQIIEKQYPEILKKFNYNGRLLLIGINYNTKTGKHTCKIEEWNQNKGYSI